MAYHSAAKLLDKVRSELHCADEAETVEAPETCAAAKPRGKVADWEQRCDEAEHGVGEAAEIRWWCFHPGSFGCR